MKQVQPVDKAKAKGDHAPSQISRRPSISNLPDDFKNWSRNDQEKYFATSITLRLFKATQRQCSYIRKSINVWKKLKVWFKPPASHKREIREYYKTRRFYKPIQKTESVDLPLFL